MTINKKPLSILSDNFIAKFAAAIIVLLALGSFNVQAGDSGLAKDGLCFSSDNILTINSDGHTREFLFGDLDTIVRETDKEHLSKVIGVKKKHLALFFLWVKYGAVIDMSTPIDLPLLEKVRNDFKRIQKRIYIYPVEHNFIKNDFGRVSSFDYSLSLIDKHLATHGVNASSTKEEFRLAMKSYYDSKAPQISSILGLILFESPRTFPKWLGSPDEPMPYEKAFHAILKLFSDHKAMTKHLIDLAIDVLEERHLHPTRVHFHHLREVLAKWEKEFGFGDEELIAYELTGDAFANLIRDKKPMSDLYVGQQMHGRETHRIQWHCIMRAVLESPETFFTDEELQSQDPKIMVADVYATVVKIKRTPYWSRAQNDWIHRGNGPWLDFSAMQYDNLWLFLFDETKRMRYSCPEEFTRILHTYFSEIGCR